MRKHEHCALRGEDGKADGHVPVACELVKHSNEKISLVVLVDLFMRCKEAVLSKEDQESRVDVRY